MNDLERLVVRSRRIGADRSLVLYGGGNTSTKTVERDHLDRERRVLRIKGSGSDLASCTAGDFPGVWLDDLLPLRERHAMSDDEMVGYLARCMVDPDAPKPSIETLLHAFLPARDVDHTHADAICALANAPDAEAAVHDALGDDIAVVPYLRPGFALSKLVADCADARAVVLAHHGLVTWGEDSYELHCELVARAAAYVGTKRIEPRFGKGVPAERGGRYVVVVDESQRELAERGDVDTIVAMRSTPDHMLRIGARSDDVVSLRPGIGCVARGRSLGEARLRAEIAAHTHATTAATLDRFGGASWLTAEEVRDFVEWPLELRKLTLKPPPPELAGTIAIVTGAASGIGREIARDLAARGASLVLADLDEIDAGENTVAVRGDLTDAAVVRRVLDAAVDTFGGLDAVVFNAGVAATGRLADVDDTTWSRSLDVNLTSQFALTRAVWPLLEQQALGGSLVYVASKNAFAPGAGFGPYSVAKAGLVQLARIAALEGGAAGIRANVVNPDAVFEGSKLWSDELRRERAVAHGIDVHEVEAFYASRSLLGRAVGARDVAEAVAFLVSERSQATTGCVITVDGGVPGAFPR